MPISGGASFDSRLDAPVTLANLPGDPIAIPERTGEGFLVATGKNRYSHQPLKMGGMPTIARKFR